MVRKVIRPSGRPKVTVRYKVVLPAAEAPVTSTLTTGDVAQAMGSEESTSTDDWLAPVRAELPIRIEDLPILRARWPGFDFRLTWPADSPGLELEVAR